MSKRWNSKSPDAQFLRDALRNGSLDPSLTPKVVHNMFEGRFHKYTLDRFRNGYSFIKRIIGLRRSPPEGMLPRLEQVANRADQIIPNSGSGLTVNSLMTVAGAKRQGSAVDGGEWASGVGEWQPDYLLVPWSSSDETRWLSVVIMLHGGVGLTSTQGFQLRVLREGKALQVSVPSPTLICNHESLLQQFQGDTLDEESQACRALAFKAAAEQYKAKKGSSVTTIQLPFSCSPVVHSFYLMGNLDDDIDEDVDLNCRCLWVDLRSASSIDTVNNPVKTFARPTKKSKPNEDKEGNDCLQQTDAVICKLEC